VIDCNQTVFTRTLKFYLKDIELVTVEYESPGVAFIVYALDYLFKDARSLGCIESRQRHISFRMKKLGMHWSAIGAESMVKVKQGIRNGTLSEVY